MLTFHEKQSKKCPRERLRERERARDVSRERDREMESTENVPFYNSSCIVQEKETNESKKSVRVLCHLRVVFQKQRWW